MSFAVNLPVAANTTFHGSDGDRLLLPPELLLPLEALLQQNKPLAFELRNPRNNTKVYGGVLEFSAPEGSTVLPHYLHTALAIEQQDVISLRLVDLPKGTYAKLQPLTSSYLHVPDFRALLESYLRTHFCTLTQGEVITLQQNQLSYDVCIAELKPASAVSIIDTELEVDIIPLESALSGLTAESAAGLLYKGLPVEGELNENTSRYFHFKWQSTTGFALKLDVQRGDVDMFVSSSNSQPSRLDNDWAFVEHGSGQITVAAADVNPKGEYFVSLCGYDPSSTFRLLLIDANPTAQPTESKDATTINVINAPSSDHFRCSNCQQWVPAQSRVMHEAFCFRNNLYCPICTKVYQKKDAALHWHCPDCGLLLPPESRDKHMVAVHVPLTCSCGTTLAIDRMRIHRKQECPDRLITCRFCGNLLPAGPLQGHSGLGEHEAYCGSRTMDCSVCGQVVQMKVLEAHMHLHELEKRHQPLPFTLCRNEVCSRSAETTNSFGLCRFCFSPLYSLTHDPGDQKLRQRLLFKYIDQLTQGCQKKGCLNKKCCRTANANLSRDNKEINQLADNLTTTAMTSAAPFYLCVDESTGRKRFRAEQLAKLGYPIEWCIKGVEEVEKARRARDSDDSDDSDEDEDDKKTSRSKTGKPKKDLLTEVAEWLLSHAPSSK